MVDAKQSETKGFILVPADGPYVQQWCAQGTILLSTGGACSGAATSKRERKRGFQAPGGVAEDVVGGLENKCVVRPVSCCVVLSPFFSCPLRQGGSSSFYRPRRERITCMARYLATWGSVVCYGVE
jgi:hypothetical protein